MSEVVVEHPAAPAESGNTYGGFAEIARRLNALHPERHLPISRQLVERWYKCRETNQFPERVTVVVKGKEKLLFLLDEVVRWHSWWLEQRSLDNAVAPRRYVGRPPIETIPLFEVDHRGHPRDNETAGYRGHPEVRENYRSSVLDL